MGRKILMASIIFFLLVFVSFQITQADQGSRGQGVKKTDTAPNRIALVIGNSAYKDSPLRNPVNDAKDIAQSLKDVGFTVDLRLDATKDKMIEAIQTFGEKITPNSIVLFYFAGHGVQSNGRNYLIPVDAEITKEGQLEFKAVEANRVLGEIDANQNTVNLVILDACRNNPFARSFRSTSNGLAQMDAPKGTLIAYATSPGKVASDGTGRNGLYTQELLKWLKSPSLKVEEVFKKVTEGVNKISNGDQLPWISSSLIGDVNFVSGRLSASTPPSNNSSASANPEEVEQSIWRLVEKNPTKERIEAYLADYPRGKYANIAKVMLKELEPKVATNPNPTTKPPISTPNPITTNPKPTPNNSSTTTNSTKPASFNRTYNTAVINSAAFSEGVGEMRKQIEKLEGEFQPRRKKLEDLQSQLVKLDEELKSAGGTIKSEVYNRKLEQFNGLKKEFDREKEDYQQDVQKRSELVLGPVQEKLSKFLETYSFARDITIIFDLPAAAQSGLVYLRPSINITEDFIANYNSTNSTGNNSKVINRFVSGNTAIIDSRNFGEGVGEMKKQLDKLETEFKPRYNELEGLQQQLVTLDDDIKKEKDLRAAQQKKDKLQTLKRDFERKREDFQQDYQKRSEVALAPLRDKVLKFLEGYSASNNITSVFDLAPVAKAGLVYTHPASNITDSFITAYNSANPVSGSSTQNNSRTSSNFVFGNTAIIDSRAFSEGVNEMKRQTEKLEKEFQARRKDLEDLQQQVAKLDNEIKLEKDSRITQQKTDKHQTLKKEYDRKKADYEEDLKKRTEQTLGAVQEKLSKFLESYASSHNFTLVFDLPAAAQGGLVFLNPSTNVTEDFIKEYNRLNY